MAVNGVMATDDITLSLRALGERLAGEVVLEGDESWDGSRRAWNLAVDQQPLAVVLPAVRGGCRRDRRRFAAEHGLRSPSTPVATTPARSTGTSRPSCSRPSACEGSASTRTGGRPESRPVSSRNRSRWPRASTTLRILSGTSADVGVVGYALGGGLSWFGRRAWACLRYDRRRRRRHWPTGG